MGHVDLGPMLSNFPKVAILVVGRLIPIRAQLQDLKGIMGPFLQGYPEVLHFLATIQECKPSGRSLSTVWPNDPKAK